MKTQGIDLAFPYMFENNYNGQTEAHGGLTKREYFVIHALQGILADQHVGTEDAIPMAVECVDRLIEELNKGEKE